MLSCIGFLVLLSDLFGYYGKIFLLLASCIVWFFKVFFNCLTKHSLPHLVRFLHLLSLDSVGFKEDKTGVTESVSFLAICSQKF